MQGLDLAKQVYKAEPSADNRAVLFNAYIGRAAELRSQNNLRDAASTLQNAVGLVDADPDRLTALGKELSACGEIRQALALLQESADSPARQEVLIRAADAAIRQEGQGQSTLPTEMQADFDRVIQAFAQLEAGQDDDARETLQAISVRSPFAEWKLLLRGLQAYYTKDDVRAIENWQRLDSERLPARLAAPLRALIDLAYRQAQPPASQHLLQVQLDRLQHQGLSPYLRTIQAALSREDKIVSAFRVLETLLPALRQQAPDLVPRLAACVYWAIINVGSPANVIQYLRAFGPPPDDPGCQRLSALACERYRDLKEANKYWEKYEKTIAGDALNWPGETGKRARAFVWLHMGRNAASVPDLDDLPDVPDFLRNHPDRPSPLKPSADRCYQHGIELCPDLLPAHEALVEYLNAKQDFQNAETAARHLLKQFPDHPQIDQDLADILMKLGKYAEALHFYQRALSHHPLDGKLRKQVGTACLYNARSLAQAKRFADAHAAYQAALEYDVHDQWTVYCKWASCEFKAGDTRRAEQLLGKASATGGCPLGIALAMLMEAIRLKLPRTLKSRFESEFKGVLDAPPVSSDAVAAIALLADHRAAEVSYPGQKTHEKNLLAYIAKVPRTEFSEEQLVRVCEAMLALRAVRPLRSLCKWSTRKFRRSPMFPLLEAESYFIKGAPTGSGAYPSKHLLEEAQAKAAAMPPSAQKTRLQDQIRARQKSIELVIDGPMSFLGHMMDAFDDDDGDDFFDEDTW
jgi:tetratricopeptide (TPR) repeat protein